MDDTCGTKYLLGNPSGINLIKSSVSGGVEALCIPLLDNSKNEVLLSPPKSGILTCLGLGLRLGGFSPDSVSDNLYPGSQRSKAADLDLGVHAVQSPLLLVSRKQHNCRSSAEISLVDLWFTWMTLVSLPMLVLTWSWVTRTLMSLLQSLASAVGYHMVLALLTYNPWLNWSTSWMYLVFLIGMAFASLSARKSLNSQQKIFLEFLRIYNYNDFPVSGDTLVVFTMYIIMSGRLSNSRSVRQYPSAASTLHKMYGHECDTPSTYGPLRNTVHGIDRAFSAPVKHRLPVGSHILFNLVSYLDHSIPTASWDEKSFF